MVIDGDSTDGSKPFLAGLLVRKIINLFPSPIVVRRMIKQRYFIGKRGVDQDITDDDSFNYLEDT